MDGHGKPAVAKQLEKKAKGEASRRESPTVPHLLKSRQAITQPQRPQETPTNGTHTALSWMCVRMYAHTLSCVQFICDPTDCSPPGPSVHGIFQARILGWVAIPFSRGSS